MTLIEGVSTDFLASYIEAQK